MNQATPAVRDLARLLLTLEPHQEEAAEGKAEAALSVLDKLRSCLSELVGVAGFQALLARALALAKLEVGWLDGVRVQTDATFDGFCEMAQHQSAEAVAEGSAALVAQLLGLLVTFIGETLTLYLVSKVWPEARLSNLHLGAEETRHE